MSVTTSDRGPIVADSLDRSSYADIEQKLGNVRDAQAMLLGANGERITLPEPLLRVLREAAHALARDRAVSVVPIPKQLTTLQAAHLLGVPHASLEKLLDEGEVPFSGMGTRRRIALDDLTAYAERRDAQRRKSLALISQLGQEIEAAVAQSGR